MNISFHPHLDVFGIAIALVFAYEYGIRRLAGRYAPAGVAPVKTWQRVAIYSGVVFLVVGSTWPVHDIGEQRLFMFHMVEHLLLTLVVPPLLLAGTPTWLMHAYVEPIIPLLKVITRPIFTLVFFNTWLAFIHVPAVVDLMLRNDLFHFFVYAVLRLGDPDVVAGHGSHSGDEEPAPFGKMGYLFRNRWFRRSRHRS